MAVVDETEKLLSPKRRSKGAERQKEEGGISVKDVAMFGAEMIPGVGEAMAIKRTSDALDEKDYLGAGIEATAGLLGIIPGVGDLAGKGLRTATKAFRKSDVEEAEKLIDNPDLLKKWEKDNTLPESQRQKNIPEAEKAAEDLYQGEITSKEARTRIKEAFPEPELYTANTMPDMPTVTEVAGSMGKKALTKGIVGVKGFDLEAGQRLGARLDIPAYNRFDKWVVSIHDGKSATGRVVGYGQAIRLKNIKFGSDPKVALDIARGKRYSKKEDKDVSQGKSTIARVFGDYVPEDPYELQEFARKILADKDSDWTQVGMNPYRGSYFYDKATGNLVTSADEVIQVGPLVLAKNVVGLGMDKKPTLSDVKEVLSTPVARTKDGKLRTFNVGGVVPMNRQMDMFQKGGLEQDGGTTDPVSGNEVPPGSTQEEVRDDIPAQLSEGEFVMPADVVRFHGLDKMMQLRQEAKMGLKIMEEMGQMGNSEEATIPDDLPFNFEDLELDDEPREMQVGGYVAPNLPMQTQQSSFANYTPQYNVPQQNQFTPYTPPVQQTTPTAPTMDTLPTFEQFVPAAGEPRKYINPETGAILMIPVDGQGNLMYPPPAGFVLESEYQAPTPDPVSTPAPVQQVSQQQQTEKDGGTPEVDAYIAERQKLMSERKKAAKKLGYTKEQSTGEAILGFLTKGLVGGNQESGTIMQDGTIADGQGNYFDPTTGEQRGFLGTTNRGKGEFQVTQEMYDQGITPASLAGLRNMIGDKSIEDLIGKSVEDATLPSPVTSVDKVSNNLTSEEAAASEDINITTDPRVETTLGQTSTLSQTEEALRDANVGDVAKYFAGEKAQEILSFMDKDGPLSNKQKLEYITILADQGKGEVNFPTKNNILPQNVDFSQFSPEARNAAKAVVAKIESEGDDAIKNQLTLTRKKIVDDLIKKAATVSSASSQDAEDAQAFRRAEARRMGVDFMSPATARKTDARNKLDDAKKSNPKQYRADVRSGKYDKEFDIIDRSTREENLEKNSRPNKAGVNLAEKVGIENASKIRDDQGTATNVDKGGNIYYDNDHDWSKKTQTNVNSGQSSGAQEKADTRDKIVCTAMNNAYGFGSFRQAIWLQHSKNMDPAYQRGYHYIFKPLIKVAYNDKKWYNIIVRKSLEGIARRRTADIWLQKKGKRHFVGAIERSILEPICYIVGKISTWKK
jgi:hypothetical protein